MVSRRDFGLFHKHAFEYSNKMDRQSVIIISMQNYNGEGGRNLTSKWSFGLALPCICCKVIFEISMAVAVGTWEFQGVFHS